LEMNMTIRFMYPLTALMAIVASGVIHGLLTDRWQTAAEPAAEAGRLELVPFVLGDWVGQDIETDRLQVGPVAGYLHRRYLNRQTGIGVTVFFVCGRPGPVCIHTPDICYTASGHEIVSQDRLSLPADVDEGEFRTAKLRKSNSTQEQQLRIFWAWSDGRAWSVPESPRLSFARCSVLFKLYLLREESSPTRPGAQPDNTETLTNDPCLDLMRLLIPEWRKAVFGT
jgi:hypothetical protein